MTAQRPPHDAFFKEVFSQAKAAEAEIEAMLPPDLAAELDFSTAELIPGSFVDEQLSERHSDLLWSVRLWQAGSSLCALGTPEPTRSAHALSSSPLHGEDLGSVVARSREGEASASRDSVGRLSGSLLMEGT